MPLTPIGKVTGFSGAIEKPSQKYGTYDFKLSFTGAAAASMKKDIDESMAVSLAIGKAKTNAQPPYESLVDELVVRFKRKAEIVTKDDRHYEFSVKLFDSKGKPIEEVLNIGEGTDMIVSYEPYLWDVASQGGCGITVQPNMAQIVNLVKYDGSGGNPFEEIEGTYEAADKDSNPFEDDSESGDF